MDGSSDLLELVSVLAGVVCAEEQLTAADQLDAYIGLRSATVTAIERRELRGGCNCSFHEWPLLFGLILPCGPIIVSDKNIQPGIRVFPTVATSISETLLYWTL